MLKFAQEQQHDQDDQHHATDTHPGVAQAVAVAPKTAAKAAQQVNNHEDDQYRSERHPTLPKASRAHGIPARGLRRKAYSGWRPQPEEPGELFRLQLQRSRIDAVAQSGRAGAILKDMAKVTAALRA